MTLKDAKCFIRHTGNGGCGEIGMYFTEKMEFGDAITSENSLMPNGEHPEAGDPLICFACHNPYPDDMKWKIEDIGGRS